MTEILSVYYIFANAVLFILMGVDKRRAKRKKWRIREVTLFLWALLGGGPGGLFGMFLFHHKNRKLKFYGVFIGTIIFHSGFIFYLVSG